MENGAPKRHPAEDLREFAQEWDLDVTSADFARRMDERDPLRERKADFHYPLKKHLALSDKSLLEDDDEECVYMCNNSLGLQPKCLRGLVENQLVHWERLGVQGHLNGSMPWAFCDEYIDEDMAKLVGAKREEVALMNGLTVNIHVMMVSFYRPTADRHKILIERHAFPSDHYSVESQIRFHGYDPEESIVYVEPREGEELLRLEDILTTLDEQGHEVALVMLPGVQYYTGQVLDMETITKHGRAKGCDVGWDLAHAVGNVELFLHDWDVDFACWCTYKYLSTGAGGVGGAFLHKRHAKNDFPKLLGWWGHKFETRFKMDNEMELSEGIRGYRISNPSMFLSVALRASLNVYMKTTMAELRKKSRLLTGYLEILLDTHLAKNDEGRVSADIITPRDPEQRGCQLSIMVSVPVRRAFDELTKRGVVLDVREPNVLRVAPTPLQNSFTDVYRFVDNLLKCLKY